MEITMKEMQLVNNTVNSFISRNSNLSNEREDMLQECYLEILAAHDYWSNPNSHLMGMLETKYKPKKKETFEEAYDFDFDAFMLHDAIENEISKLSEMQQKLLRLMYLEEYDITSILKEFPELTYWGIEKIRRDAVRAMRHDPETVKSLIGFYDYGKLISLMRKEEKEKRLANEVRYLKGLL